MGSVEPAPKLNVGLFSVCPKEGALDAPKVLFCALVPKAGAGPPKLKLPDVLLAGDEKVLDDPNEEPAVVVDVTPPPNGFGGCCLFAPNANVDVAVLPLPNIEGAVVVVGTGAANALPPKGEGFWLVVLVPKALLPLPNVEVAFWLFEDPKAGVLFPPKVVAEEF